MDRHEYTEEFQNILKRYKDLKYRNFKQKVNILDILDVRREALINKEENEIDVIKQGITHLRSNNVQLVNYHIKEIPNLRQPRGQLVKKTAMIRAFEGKSALIRNPFEEHFDGRRQNRDFTMKKNFSVEVVNSVLLKRVYLRDEQREHKQNIQY